MIQDLTPEEIDQILRRQRVGRIGATSVGHVEITPIVYGYDGASIFGHSRFGRKIQYMRGNPEICFEVEEVIDPTSWQVVVLHGTYSELSEPHERDIAMRLILAQAGGGPESSAVQVERGDDLVIYRISIAERSGLREAGLEDA
jgi:nitroimidazol reductase NimA-like FMN-containing flavoprotein (pyridoxamine 5'-phosphate oxidase superfamily)